jgi:hypothetical protein
MTTPSRPRATFGCEKRNAPGVLFRSQTMHDRISANIAMFASPPITMVAFLALITALALAQQQVKGTKATGAATLRNVKLLAVWTAMDLLRSYVQSLSDMMNAEGAAALIEAAGLVVGGATTYHKNLLKATLTTTPGTVHLDAYALLLVGRADIAKKALFNWQWSGDEGATWNDLRATPHANTDVVGLALLTTYRFRVSVTVGKVTGAWSEAVSLLVHG